ncbi:lachesin-like isoform X2 [Artemia franciscana]|uniref:lachesin-like isoform X2 n=1 Tax=Artemia franciscana TaxID=6661 RepID=UPI0032DA4AF2
MVLECIFPCLLYNISDHDFLYAVAISVRGAPRPSFLEPIRNVTVALGREAVLNCVVEDLGPFKVAWVHLDRNMIIAIHKNVLSRITRYSVSYDHHRSWRLHVKNTQSEDAGRYMCQVNAEPMISQVGHLDVVVPPTISDNGSSPSQVTAREGTRVSLVCQGEGRPLPKVAWRREDGKALIHQRRSLDTETFQGEELILPKVSRTDTGAYFCIASNGVPPIVSKRVLLDVEFAPTVNVPDQLIGAIVGTEVTLECRTEAWPRPIIYWIRGSQDSYLLPGKPYKAEVSENGFNTKSLLRFTAITQKDFGTYKCMSKNALGEAEGTIRLYEMTVPVVSKASSSKRTKSDGEIQKTTTSFKIHEPQIYLNSRKIKTEQPQDKNLVFSEKSNAQKNEDDMKWTETQPTSSMANICLQFDKQNCVFLVLFLMYKFL